ncbi:MAG: hypothetical protein PHU53_07035 [Thermoplasmata archaeon]|nr:hypothetical protein [Thermoplasmata archaeon]
MFQRFKNTLAVIFGNDNTRINTGAIFAGVGFLITCVVVIVYAFVYRTDIGENISNVLITLAGGGTLSYGATMLRGWAGRSNSNDPSQGEGP